MYGNSAGSIPGWMCSSVRGVGDVACACHWPAVLISHQIWIRTVKHQWLTDHTRHIYPKVCRLLFIWSFLLLFYGYSFYGKENFTLDFKTLLWGFDCVSSQEHWWGWIWRRLDLDHKHQGRLSQWYWAKFLHSTEQFHFPAQLWGALCPSNWLLALGLVAHVQHEHPICISGAFL